ncbi:DUF2141 domain-containing protein [Gilvimarinus xylanilyticus]|uniref:DUF2141 domain-containing protein n=1 Tax=Gilvimarinus xylanilyticus TaxID=2944139 RepID=A0A9X2KUB6_9GAMM|nr:DUF2141 domain-containing protein [Gilvimarinus xylanilyticus]MCP8900149.1 DUF2141 domain-containing protein [Gilvimarinus xylanilyticus]
MILLLLVDTLQAESPRFTLQINGNQSAGATLYLAIYPADSDDWQAEAHQNLKRVLPDTEQVQWPLDLPAGRYAIKAFVDLNHNGQLDRKNRRTPLEPFAFSLGDGRDKPGISFNKAVFTLDGEHTTARLPLQYPKQRAR